MIEEVRLWKKPNSPHHRMRTSVLATWISAFAVLAPWVAAAHDSVSSEFDASQTVSFNGIRWQAGGVRCRAACDGHRDSTITALPMTPGICVDLRFESI